MKKILFSSEVLFNENEQTYQSKGFSINGNLNDFCRWREVSQVCDGMQFWNGLAVKIKHSQSCFVVNSYTRYFDTDNKKGYTRRGRQACYVTLQSTLKHCLSSHIPFNNNTPNHTFIIYAEDNYTMVVEDCYSSYKNVYKIKMLSRKGERANRFGMRTPFAKGEYFTKMHLR